MASLERARIEAHLASCAGCRQSLERLRRTADLLGQMRTPPIPEGFASRVVALAEQRRQSRDSAFQSAWNPRQWWRAVSTPVRVAAGLALAMGLTTGVVAARSVGQASSSHPARTDSQQVDPLATYGIDYLTDTPSGSLAQSFVDLLLSPKAEGR
jgi:anti-sigma factor RsiW